MTLSRRTSGIWTWHSEDLFLWLLVFLCVAAAIHQTQICSCNNSGSNSSLFLRPYSSISISSISSSSSSKTMTTPVEDATGSTEDDGATRGNLAVRPADLEEGTTPTSNSVDGSHANNSQTTGTSSVLHQDLIQSKILQDGHVPAGILAAAGAGGGSPTAGGGNDDEETAVTPSTDTSTLASSSAPAAASSSVTTATSDRSPPSVNPQGLPVATIPEQPNASSASVSSPSQQQPVYNAKPVQEEDCLVNKKQAFLLAAILAIVIVIVVSVSVVMVQKRNERNKAARSSSTASDVLWYTSNDTALYSVATNLLPDYTVRALQKDVMGNNKANATATEWYMSAKWNPQADWKPSSPQGQAWKWLVSDPKATAVSKASSSASMQAYSEEEIVTRLALAVVFFATNGRNWDNTSNWLSTANDDDNDICTWFSSKVSNGDRYQNERIRKYDDYVSWCRQAGFRELRLSSNKLIGQLPQEIGMLTMLTTLSLNFNELGGTIPSTIAQLSRLNTLECYACGLRGNVTNLIKDVSATMTNLTKLRLPINSFRGSIPMDIAKLTMLSDLRLYANQVSGSIPDELWTKWQERMFHLKLNVNKITGSFPSLIGGMTNLRSLTMDNNLLNGTIPTEFGNLDSLLQLSIYTNKITGTYPTELGKMTSLEHFLSGDNRLTGTIFTEIGNMRKLQYVEMESQKRLVGTIPTEIGHLRPSDFYVGLNFLTGTIPTEMGLWNNTISAFSLGHNQLTGTIPEELGSLTKCNAFYVAANKLTGTIPTVLGNLRDCSSLDLMDNLLTGTIPTELGNCPILGNLLMALNDLTGSVPTEVCSLFTPADESKEIMVDCKEITCTCNCTCDNPYDSLLSR